MPNKIKYNPGIDPSSLNPGNWSIGIDGTGLGPSLTTGFNNGMPIPKKKYDKSQGEKMLWKMYK